MITCTGCKREKPEDSFPWRNKAAGIRQSYCKECKKSYNKTWYANKADSHKENVKKNNQRYYDAVKQYIREAKSVPCADCYETFPFWQMDFDHLEEKEFNVGNFGNRSLDTIKAEIAKCEVVCKMCHADRTMHRRFHPLTLPLGRAISVVDPVDNCPVCLYNRT